MYKLIYVMKTIYLSKIIEVYSNIKKGEVKIAKSLSLVLQENIE